MANELKVKAINVDSDTIYKTLEIKIGTKSLITPVKSLDLTKFIPNVELDVKIKGINEIYKKLDEEKAKKMISDTNEQGRFNYSIMSSASKANQNKEINLCIIDYSGRYPSGRVLEFVADTVYGYSDIVPVPIISDIGDRIKTAEDLDSYLKFLKNFLQNIGIHRKPVMGLIPPIAFLFVPDLINFYIKNGINAFYFDFDGKNPISLRQNITATLRNIENENLLGKSFIHAINVNIGRSIRKADVIPAKDILGFGFGIDSLGGKHKPLKIPKDYFERIPDSEKRKLRLFNKEDYGYYKIEDLSQIKKIVPKDSAIKIDNFSEKNLKKLKKVQSLFNMEQQGLESLRLREIIKENEVGRYLEKKKYIKNEDIKKMLKIKKDIVKKTRFGRR
nr:hypothetical protein [Candidatus Freyarchaeota archaeon]